jgi:hypothetical protein
MLADCWHRWLATKKGHSLNWIDLLQWPAMLVTVLAAWFVASHSERRRNLGFWCYMLSNVLWIAWGWSTQAYALITLQLALAAMNIRGLKKTSE